MWEFARLQRVRLYGACRRRRARSTGVTYFSDRRRDRCALRTKPKVSVVIPAYNAAAHIAAALDSVFAQTFTDFEVIVINDGSPDTRYFEQAIEPFGDRIIYLKQENRGPSGARNVGVRAAQGEFIAFLDSDDGWQPEYLAAQTEFLRQDPSLDLVYCDGVNVGDGALAGTNLMASCPSRGPATFGALLVEDCKVFTFLTVARREAVLRAGLFDERFSNCEDYDLWLRMAHQGSKIGYHTRVLGWHRLRPDSLSAESVKMYDSAVAVLAKLEKELALDPALRALLQRQQARFQSQRDREEGRSRLLAGDVLQARELLARANASSSSFRLKLALVALRVAPRLTTAAARRWVRFKR